MESSNSVPIKSFIYLDNDKMFSISSQLFEGMPHYILQTETQGYEEDNEQKGKLLSGRFMADMISQQSSRSEVKYLHDFAFNLFEKELIERDKLYSIQATDTLQYISDKRFIKVSGKLLFTDYESLKSIIANFNDIGRAFGELSMQSTISQIDELGKQTEKIADREKKNKGKQIVKQQKSIIDQQLKKSGLLQDEKMLKNLSVIMDFGYSDNYEVRIDMPESELCCTAVVNKDYLREPVQVLISKYARNTEVDFTVVGIVTQSGKPKAQFHSLGDNIMKTASQSLTEQYAKLEELFIGRTSNEFIVDPIAIYTEL